MSTAYLAEWARKKRAALLVELGNTCAREGCEDTRLEFHHPHGRDWDPAKLSRWQRMIQYARDAAAGNLTLLCKSHNASDGQRFRGRGRRGVHAMPALPALEAVPAWVTEECP
jgi:hypothetical protein